MFKHFIRAGLALLFGVGLALADNGVGNIIGAQIGIGGAAGDFIHQFGADAAISVGLVGMPIAVANLDQGLFDASGVGRGGHFGFGRSVSFEKGGGEVWNRIAQAGRRGAHRCSKEPRAPLGDACSGLTALGYPRGGAADIPPHGRRRVRGLVT